MIANKKTEVPKENLKYLAVICDEDTGRVLTVADWHLRRTVAHETALGSTIVGEYSDKGVAERAVKLVTRGWLDAKNTGT